jgi:hypothetical protein
MEASSNGCSSNKAGHEPELAPGKDQQQQQHYQQQGPAPHRDCSLHHPVTHLPEVVEDNSPWQQFRGKGTHMPTDMCCPATLNNQLIDAEVKRAEPRGTGLEVQITPWIPV